MRSRVCTAGALTTIAALRGDGDAVPLSPGRSYESQSPESDLVPPGRHLRDPKCSDIVPFHHVQCEKRCAHQPIIPPLTHGLQACGDQGGASVDCQPRHAATPMLPQTYFKSPENVPQDFLQSSNKYYYLSRFTYAFYIISIFWILLALLATLGALLSTLSAALAAALSAIALLSTAFLAAIMTYVVGPVPCFDGC